MAARRFDERGAQKRRKIIDEKPFALRRQQTGCLRFIFYDKVFGKIFSQKGEKMEDVFSYDAIPYPSKIFSQTNPDRLATLAKLYGMNPPEIETCRFLELGCGNGSNMLAQAFVFPNAEFVGIDLSEKHIFDARQNARELNLPNARFQQIDVMKMSAKEFGKFDYIVAHGLFSWVPDFVREKVLEIYREMLAPNGVGYISYNAYPGGHIREMAHRMMRYHTRDTNEPVEKVQKAITFLAFLAENSAEKETFQPIWERELGRHFENDTADVFHDDLAEFYKPFYFYEFAELIEKRGLQFISEAEITAMSPYSFSKDVQQMLGSLGEIEREQYMDFLRGRYFRQSLVCHKETPLNRQIEPSALKNFHISSAVRPRSEKPDFAPHKVENFVGKKNVGFEIDHPLTKAALVYLGEIWGNSANFSGIIENARRILKAENVEDGDSEQDCEIVAAILWQMCLGTGSVEINANPRNIRAQAGDKPKVNRLARWQIKRGQNISTFFGTSIKAEDEISRRLIELMDGTRTRAELLKQIGEFVENVEDMPDRQEILDDMPNWLNENIMYSERMSLFE